LNNNNNNVQDWHQKCFIYIPLEIGSIGKDKIRYNDTKIKDFHTAMNQVNNIDLDAESVPSPFHNFDIVKCIVSFVGRNQYRFVATINHDFKASYQQLYPFNKRTYYNARTVGHAKICYEECQFIRRSHAAKLCASAARHGGLFALMYLREEKEVPWDRHKSRAAARFGQLHILQYLHTNHCPWDSVVCSNAARNGHLTLLQWARENHCPWKETTCRLAAQNAQIEVLQWAHANGCPWDKRTCRDAAASGQLAAL
jgi:hypothetical protein